MSTMPRRTATGSPEDPSAPHGTPIPRLRLVADEDRVEVVPLAVVGSADHSDPLLDDLLGELGETDLATEVTSLLDHADGRLCLVVARVDQVRGPAVVERLPRTDLLVEPLTAKELEVLGHLGDLLTTEEIAEAMYVSVNTVRTHVRSILRKLDVNRRNNAVRRARELGLLPR